MFCILVPDTNTITIAHVLFSMYSIPHLHLFLVQGILVLCCSPARPFSGVFDILALYKLDYYYYIT